MSASSTRTPPIVRFYDPHLKAPDAQGRNLSDILSWSDSRLEYSHDYIQTLFPLPERSPVDPSAPIIDHATFTAFRSRPEIRVRLRLALERICQFYGFRFQETDEGGSFRIEKQGSGRFEARARNWVSRFNHNHLRITRIIRCLRVLGLDEEAKAFFDAVKKVRNETGRISDRSLMFWTRAMERPLYLAPEDEEDQGMGKDFLYEFENQKDGGESAKDGSGMLGEAAESDNSKTSHNTKDLEGDENIQSTTPDNPNFRDEDETPTNTIRRTKPKLEEL
ncbi:MAG: hypothetical protein Q9195_004352 [Heterodermia aff. obscurata]